MDFSWVQTDVENIVGPVLNMDLISRRPGSDVYFIVANDGSRPQPYVVKCATRLDEEMHANSVMIEHGLRVPRVKRFIPNAFKERDVIISHPVQGSHLSDLLKLTRTVQRRNLLRHFCICMIDLAQVGNTEIFD